MSGLHRTAVTVFDPDGSEAFRVMDMRKVSLRLSGKPG